jgi:hypothetical protein
MSVQIGPRLVQEHPLQSCLYESPILTTLPPPISHPHEVQHSSGPAGTTTPVGKGHVGFAGQVTA